MLDAEIEALERVQGELEGEAADKISRAWPGFRPRTMPIETEAGGTAQDSASSEVRAVVRAPLGYIGISKSDFSRI